MTTSTRISSIDIMRGLTLVLMLFVNDLNMQVAPAWIGHRPAEFDGMGLADWVFPGFLFLVGMAIPFALSKRFISGQSVKEVSRHILARSVALILIGVLMLNSGRLNPELSGISKNLWALLLYLAVFLYFNDYPDKDNKFFTILGLKFLALAILAFLVLKFKSGHPENNGSFITGWWGILGLIGWGYLVSAFAYVICRDSILKTSVFAVFFLILNVLSSAKILDFLNPVKPFLGIIIEGNVPFIVLCGLAGGLIIKKIQIKDYLKVILIFTALGLGCLAAGFFLRKWFIISKIFATPSWGLICNGISFLVFTALYWIVDVKEKKKWAGFIRPAGENSLTTYLAPDVLYYLIWMTGLPVFFYQKSLSAAAVIAGSLIWALLMVQFTALLARLKIRLRL